MLLFLLACIDTNIKGGDDDITVTIPDAPPVSLTIEPQVLDFGLVPLGTETAAELTVTNTGSADTFIVAHRFSDEGFQLAASNNTIAPGESERVQIYWTPDESGELSGEVTITAGTAVDTQEDLPVGLAGLAEGPEVFVTLANHDFGEMLVGCSVGIPFNVSNVGNVDLIVSGVGLSYTEEFSLSSPEGAIPEFPWVLEAGEGHDLTLTYAPELDRPVSTTLRVSSNDPIASTVDVIANGSAVTEGENTDLFVVNGDQAVTMIIAANEIVKYDEPYRGWFDAAVPTLFQTLQSLDLEYRIAFVGVQSGDHAGDLPYIDSTLSPDEAASAVAEMLDNVSDGDDNHSLFLTLSNALGYNAGWVVEEDLWLESKLGLVGINNTPDDSEGGFEGWVDTYRGYKEETEDVLVHAIGGPVGGCEDEARGAKADEMQGFQDATGLTGGLFFSVCDDDWRPHFEAFAASMEGRRRTLRFELSQNPDADSIEVWKGEVLIQEGWRYDVLDNAVIFEEEELPEAGTELEIFYLLGTCND